MEVVRLIACLLVPWFLAVPIFSSSRPNVLLIVSEDNGAELGCYGTPDVQTPRLDRLAAEGCRFANAYVPHAVCSASRAAFLTGLYPFQNGQIGLATHRYSMFRNWDNLPGILKAHGYRTGLMGKLHVNPESAFPFDFRWNESKANSFGSRNVGRVAEVAGEFFRGSEQPFFLSLNFSDAHFPILRQQAGLPEKPLSGEDVSGPLPFIGADSPRLRQGTADYYNCMMRLDSGVGMVLDELEGAGKADNTLVIYIGDHGAQFSRGKATCYEGGLRIPMIVRWPGQVVPQTVRDELVTTIDILPTVLQATALPARASLQGSSLLPLAAGRDVPWRQYLFAERTAYHSGSFYPQRTLRDERYKVILNLTPDQPNPVAKTYETQRGAFFIYGTNAEEIAASPEPVQQAYATWHNPPPVELYDLKEDPWEFRNLSDDPAFAGAKLRLLAELRKFREHHGDPLLDQEKLRELAEEHHHVATKVKGGRYGSGKKWKYQEYLAPPQARQPSPATYSGVGELGEAVPVASFEHARPGEFEKLGTAIGVWSPDVGQTIIDHKHAKTGKQCLQLTGGKETRVILQLAGAADPSAMLAFWAERWTARAPFSFRIEKNHCDGWEEIYNGDNRVLVGRSFLNYVKVPLQDPEIRKLRFLVTSPPGTGVLIDDVRIGPPSESDQFLGREILFHQRPIPAGVPLEGHSKEAKVYGYRIPSLLVTKKGSILAFTERRLGLHDHAQNDIVLKRSTDGGKTWGDEIIAYEDGMNSINDPLTVQLENGRILLMFARFPYGRHARDAGWIKMADPGYDDKEANVLTFLCHSDDDGLTWSKPMDISRQVKHPELLNANTPGAMVQLAKGPHKGRIVTGLWGTLPVMKDGKRSREWRIVVAYSDDNGQSWKRTGLLVDESNQGFPNECQVAEAANGDIVLISRNQGGERYRKKAVSHDGGETWGPINIDTSLPSVACMGSVIKGPAKKDGTWDLWASFPSRNGRKDGQIAVSRDNGRTWQVVKVIPGPFAYSALQVSPDQKSLLCLYESNGYRTETLLRIPFAELSQLEAKGGTAK